MPGPQAKAEDLTRNYVRRLRELGITQATVLVVSTRTMEAYVGSSDFDDAARQASMVRVLTGQHPQATTLRPGFRPGPGHARSATARRAHQLQRLPTRKIRQKLPG